MAHQRDRTGVLLLRIWVEVDHETGIRGRIIGTPAMIGTGGSGEVAASEADICAAVKRWVDAFVQGASVPTSGS